MSSFINISVFYWKIYAAYFPVGFSHFVKTYISWNTYLLHLYYMSNNQGSAFIILLSFTSFLLNTTVETGVHCPYIPLDKPIGKIVVISIHV
jgi:hypothetical protein